MNNDTLYYVFHYLDIKSLLSCSLVDIQWNAICFDDSIWKNLCFADFNDCRTIFQKDSWYGILGAAAAFIIAFLGANVIIVVLGSIAVLAVYSSIF